jgi:hypothetical protein
MPALIGDTTLWSALAGFQERGVSLQKNAINPHFKNRYISLDSLLESVLPALTDVGILLVQEPTHINGEPALRTRLVHIESGDSLDSTMPLVLAKDDPQGQGSAITYARRYSLMSTLGLVADEDNDGEGVRTKARPAKVREVVQAVPVAAVSESPVGF